MRTNIVLDDKLLRAAFRVSKAKTKKDFVQEALKNLIDTRQKRDLRDLRGMIAFKEGYDHKALRKG